jgi:AcrR family transcriptional regulator
MPETVTDTAEEPEPASYRGAVRQLLRDRLLDAAREELRARPWTQVTMARIAAAAGVSRQTLYNEFGTRDEFGQALVIREGSRFLDAVEEAIGQFPEDPLAALTAALERFLTLATTDPFVRLLLSDDGQAGCSRWSALRAGRFSTGPRDGSPRRSARIGRTPQRLTCGRWPTHSCGWRSAT